MSKKRVLAFAAAFAALTLLAAACGGGEKKQTSNIKRGGAFRIQTDQFLWDADLDPTGEYLGFSWDLFYAMHRPLLGYNHKAGTKGGDVVLPDLATDLGQVSADGLTWTFKIKRGIKFGPPLNREVTTKDLVYSITRSANLTISASGPFAYMEVIEGFKAVEDGKATSVSGMTTPDDQTIVFKLTKPTGDWRYRVAQPFTAPIPEEIAKCFTKAAEYGRFQVGTGPYQIRGIDKLDTSSCDAMKKKPTEGFDPTQFVHLVRNPSYDASTDTKAMRENFVDSIDMTLNTNADDVMKKILEGSVDDGEVSTVPPSFLQKADTDPTVKDNVHVDPGDRTWYIHMHMAKPPFDDIHVRKAVNFVVDKAALVRARGGHFAGIPAEHIIPPDVLGGRLKVGEFDPYASEGHKGDVAKALAEMKLSKYDKNKDGKCDESPACKNVVHGTRSAGAYPDMATLLANDLAKIGITLKTKLIGGSYYKAVQVPSATPQIGSGAGWGKDFPDAGTFYTPLLSSAVITPGNSQNFAYLGITAAQAHTLKFPYPSGGVPSADADIAICQAKLGDARNDCWAALDKKTMTEMVPWVPYLWATNITVVSDAVTNYEFDQSGSGEIAFTHVAVDTAKQKTT